MIGNSVKDSVQKNMINRLENKLKIDVVTR